MNLIESIVLLVAILFSTSCFAQDVTITVVYNNVPYNNELTPAWGTSCLIEGLEKTILFDTGGDSSILLSNMKKLGIDPMGIDIVILSHIHADHTGGLWGFLETNSQITVYIPQSFPESFKNRAKKSCKEVVLVHKPLNLCNHVWTTGELGAWIKEQALIIDTQKGLIVITGCAHPGIVNIVKFAKNYLKKDVYPDPASRGGVYLVMGGFHLMAYSESQVGQIIKDLKKIGVKKIGPSHCTGGRPIELFRNAWGKDFIDLGCGARVEIR